MSHSIMVPVTGQGTVVDQNVARYVPQLMRSGFGFTDVFFYSHGWWTTALSAMVDYSRFSVGMLEEIVRVATVGKSRPPSALQVGIHWPSMISEDSNSIISVLQPLTFYNRAAMADDVGEHGGGAVLQLIAQAAAAANVALRIHLIGHSFGCRVVCSSLQSLLGNVDRATLLRHRFNLILLQGAIDTEALDAGRVYGKLLDAAIGVPNLRVLISTSQQDAAVGTEYPRAWRLVHLFGKKVTGLGATGPSANTPGAAAATKVSVGPNYTIPAAAGLRGTNFVVADLTPLHQYRLQNKLYEADPHSGSHSDIYVEEVYGLIAGFL